MGQRDPRVDAYIDSAAPFARPILRHLRATVHAACPAVEEALKWGHPHFLYRGMLCGMAAFKQHCAFGFWKSRRLLAEPSINREAMGQFGRLTRIADLPPRSAIGKLIRRAMALNQPGEKPPERARRRPRPAPRIPADLRQALAGDAAARATYAALSPSGQREYVEWLDEARQPATRVRRLATTLEWLAAGKGRNWKYERRARR
jgi:uncharacterized protein YdeI (YjbR/CyaY-like superfamily)